MTQAELNTTLKNHAKWLTGASDGKKAILNNTDLRKLNLCGAGLRDADLRCVNLSGTDLRCANLSCANLNGANLTGANLGGANLNGAKLEGTNFTRADLSCSDLNNTNLSGAIGLTKPIDYLNSYFEQTSDGYIVYKTFNMEYKSPNGWVIKPGTIIEEEPNYNRTSVCGSGINAATKEWVKLHYPNSEIYKLLIKWAWLPGVVVPYNTDGKIRCAKAQIVCTI